MSLSAERARLDLLMTDELPLEAIASADHSPAPSGPDGRWTRTYGRLEPGPNPFVALVLERSGDEQLVFRVEGFAERPSQAGDGAAPVRHEQVGWLRAVPLPSDPRLPTLPAVLAAVERPTVVRYRPYSRCTVRVERDGKNSFAKVFSDGRGTRVHAEGVQLWRAARRGELRFLVARPERLDLETGAAWQGELHGAAVTTRILSGDVGLAERMGSAAASLTRSSVRPYRVMDYPVQLAKSTRRSDLLRRLVPQLDGPTRLLVRRLQTIPESTSARPLRPIHGDLSLGQWVDAGQHLGLVDFEDLALGDPERDAANFLVEVGVQDPDRVPAARLGEGFLAGYESVLGPLDRTLLGAYMAQKALRRATIAACTVRPDFARKAEALVERAGAWLQEGPPA
jgi:Phosphotransferase enzyme family